MVGALQFLDHPWLKAAAPIVGVAGCSLIYSLNECLFA